MCNECEGILPTGWRGRPSHQLIYAEFNYRIGLIKACDRHNHWNSVFFIAIGCIENFNKYMKNKLINKLPTLALNEALVPIKANQCDFCRCLSFWSTEVLKRKCRIIIYQARTGSEENGLWPLQSTLNLLLLIIRSKSK
jgi:hypothetical protein